MIQFFGLHLNQDSASVSVLGRDLRVTAEVATKMVNVEKDPASPVVEVPIAEWVRAGAYALQEAYFQLPVSARKAWGLGLAGPDGWIALDVGFDPISPLRLTGRVPVEEDLARWLAVEPRRSRKVSVILSPKDYFRFAVSGGFAADVTSASRLGLLEEGASQWSADRAGEKNIPLRWLPPVFDAHVTTGRLSEDGMRRTSLPGGFWLVAGAHEAEAAIVAAGDLRGGKLWVVSRPGAPAIAAYGVPHLAKLSPPDGWRAVRSAMAGHQILEW